MIDHNQFKFLSFLVGFIFIFTHIFSISEEKKSIISLSDEKIITKLIATIADSNLKFIRNGSSYSAKEAASHLQLKLEITSKKKFNGKITVCEFINNVATKSIFSGLPYQIEVESGKKILLHVWLIENLKKQDAALAERCNKNSGD
ncbi:DUF5329 family protein [Fluviispira sanaruensis]|uniref:Uncharacterized protein n=1 Tax=Fluviispira sanaruensis TaxID=2493639 RepID=A0A4P2VVY6_FLUSA|nr:DUF5329 family protein [Fluviispira sanaruensis]BBH53102.1 hypothetical protein JCM31447_15450 [Fluviispira sanaruensis]